MLVYFYMIGNISSPHVANVLVTSNWKQNWGILPNIFGHVSFRIHSLKLTAKGTENGWNKQDDFPFRKAYFQGLCSLLVSREGGL